MSTVERRASELIAALKALGIPADTWCTETDNEGVNVWAPSAAVTDDHPNLNRYPQASVVISDNERYRDYSWGPAFEHVLPIETPVAVVAAAIFETLPVEVRQAVSV